MLIITFKSLVTAHILEKKSYIPSKYLIYKSRALNFAFRKLEFDTIYNAYSNILPFKYYISIFGGGGSEAMLMLLI